MTGFVMILMMVMMKEVSGKCFQQRNNFRILQRSNHCLPSEIWSVTKKSCMMICTKIMFEYSYSCYKWYLNSQCFGSQLSFCNLHSIQSLELVDVLSWLELNSPHMCHRHHRRGLQRKILPCGEISDWTRKLSLLNVEKICHMEKFLHMRNVETNLSI